MNGWLIGGAAVLALGGASLYNYRRFMPRARSFSEKPFQVNIQPLPIQAGAHQLYGELLRPKGMSGPLPTVICCHGFGSSYKLCRDTMGKCFAMSGLQVYVFDFYGGSKKSRSGGTMLEMSIFTEREDLNAVIDFIAQRPEVDKNNLFLLGESQGGCVSGITAPAHLDQLKALILYYPAFCIPEDAQKKFKRVEDIPEASKTFDLNVGKIYNEKLLDYDIYAEIKAFHKPVLIMHGDKDTVVPIEYGKRAAEVYPNARFETFPGEVHGFMGKGKLKAAEMSYQFVREQMRA